MNRAESSRQRKKLKRPLAKWKAFVDAVVAERYRGGLSLVSLNGTWRSPDPASAGKSCENHAVDSMTNKSRGQMASHDHELPSTLHVGLRFARKADLMSFGMRLALTRHRCLVFAWGVASVVLSLQGRGLASPPGTPFSIGALREFATHPGLMERMPKTDGLGPGHVLAFEDNPRFRYLCLASDGGAVSGNRPGATPPDKPRLHIRRLIGIKPAVVLIEDRLLKHGSQGRTAEGKEYRFSISAPGYLRRKSEGIAGETAGKSCLFSAIYPADLDWEISAESATGTGEEARTRAFTVGPPCSRTVTVFAFKDGEDPVIPPHKVQEQAGTVAIELQTGSSLAPDDQVVAFSLPPDPLTGSVQLSSLSQNDLFDIRRRLLPGGVLPFGTEGFRLMRGWDIPYRNLDSGLANWDTGTPSSQLAKVLTSARIRPGRALELGCGTGSDAIFLAQQAFDVTAIDIAPTALRIAEERAADKEVKVRWLLADVLRPPPLRPFDFVYDRGCYHAVRLDSAAGYATSLRKLTARGSRILILAGKADRNDQWNFAGPPRVTEEQIRADFRDGFRIVKLEAFRFDPKPPAVRGALAWCILLERVKDGADRTSTGSPGRTQRGDDG